jgi:dTDP-4-amino-4,6-dideoxygalactose transaminase
LGYKVGDLPVTETIAREQLSLPMFPELSEDQIDRVAREIAAWTGKKA